MGLRVLQNASVADVLADAELSSALLDEQACREARATVADWPFYQITPLYDLAGFSECVGVGHVFAKDESARLPLKSFKMLGAVYALAKAIHNENPAASLADMFGGGAHASNSNSNLQDFRVVAATDGNHGTALAWAAQNLGVACSIYLPSDVSPGREKTINSLGAEIVRVDGSYDDAVHKAYGDAQKNGWTIIQDTAPEGFEHHCLNIMYGYTTLIHEAIAQLNGVQPTHVMAQAGVGGFAAAVASYLVHRYGKDRPKLITVESENADCVLESLKHGKRTTVPGPHTTMMGGIACGEVSEIAWDILRGTIDGAVAIDDGLAKEALSLVATGVNGDPALEVGETGSAGLAALLALSRDNKAATQLALDTNSKILVFITEGITDPETYRTFMEC